MKNTHISFTKDENKYSATGNNRIDAQQHIERFTSSG